MAALPKGASKGFSYSKWDNIELSDDESDCHPNIDKQSWYVMLQGWDLGRATCSMLRFAGTWCLIGFVPTSREGLDVYLGGLFMKRYRPETIPPVVTLFFFFFFFFFFFWAPHHIALAGGARWHVRGSTQVPHEAPRSCGARGQGG